MNNRMSALKSAFWFLVFLGALPALIYLVAMFQGGVRGEAFAQPVYFRGYYGVGFIVVFVCIAWLAQQLNLWWGVFLGLPALFVGVYPALENFGSEKLVAGAVVAFDLDQCPSGWDRYEAANARVLVGAGKGTVDEQGRNLSERKRGITGGEEVHKLTVSEMPRHNHDAPEKTGNYSALLRYENGGNTAGSLDGTGGEPSVHSFGVIQAQGGDQPHNTMPPFIALTFCVKKQ